MRFMFAFLGALSLVSPAAEPCYARSAASQGELRGMKHPALSPDGKQLAFSVHGDLWLCAADGGKATRLTTDPADEQSPAWSPDGKSLAFSSDKNGNRDLFILAIDGGEVRQLTSHSSADDRPAWSPDGLTIAFESTRDSNVDLCLNNDVWDLWRVPAAGGTAQRITRFRGENPCWSPDGKQIAYDRYSSGYADGEHNIFIISADGSGIPKEIASGPEDSRRPAWKGGTIYFAHEADGIYRAGSRNIWKAPQAGGALVQLTGLRGDHVTFPTVCAASDVMVFEYDFDLYSVNLKQKPPTTPAKIKITYDNPYKDDANATKTYTTGLKSPAWSPDGAHIAGILDGDLVVMDADGSHAKVLTRTLDEERDPSWAGNDHIVCVRAAWGGAGHVVEIALDGTERTLTKEAASYRAPVRSRDLLAVQVDDAGERGIYLIDLKTNTKRAIADEKGVDESSPAWVDGSVAYLRGAENGASEIVIRPLEGAARTLDSNRSIKAQLRSSAGGTQLCFTFVDLSGGAWNVAMVDVKSGRVTAMPADQQVNRTAPSWAPDDSMLLFEENRVNRFQQNDGREQLWVRDAAKTAVKLQVKYSIEKPWSRRDDMTSLFLQTWNAYDRNYYDPFFHGVDWTAAREKYRPFASDAQTKAELYEIINDMIRELRSSHIHLTPAPVKNSVITGAVGADVEVVDGGVRLVRVEPNGPAAKAGLKDGDVIEKVGDQPVGDFDRQLTFADVIKEVTLGIRDRDPVTVKPVNRNDLRKLKYDNQVARAKAFVKEKSDGRLGYHHITMMMPPEVTRMKTVIEKEYAEAAALVLDIRDGVGGNTHKQVINLLDSKAPDRINANPAGFTRMRNGTMQPDKYTNGFNGGRMTGKSFDRPVIMITNEVSRSDKEILPWTFRASGVGYLVGMPTAGGVIGGSDWTLKDGAKITVSGQGWFTNDGRNLEGWGVPPDYRVPMTHDDLYAGRDPQLEKAVEVLLGQLDGKVPPPRTEKK